MLLQPLGEKFIFFGIFRVRHANQGWKKYGIYSCLFFIWHLECNGRRQIKNAIPHFVAPKLRATIALFIGRDQSYLTRLICCSWSRKIYVGLILGVGQKIFFFGQQSTSQHWPAATKSALGFLGHMMGPKASFWPFWLQIFEFSLLKNFLEQVAA